MELRVWLSVPNSQATQYLHGIESGYLWKLFYFILFYFLFNYIYNSKLKRVILNFDWRSLELHIIGFLINSISSIQDFVLFYFLFIWVEVRITMMKGFAQQTTRCVTKSHHVWLRWIRCSLQWVLSAWVGSSTIKWALWVKT